MTIDAMVEKIITRTLELYATKTTNFIATPMENHI